VRFYTENGRFAFLNLFGGLETTYDVHIMLIEKFGVDFLLVLIEDFWLGAIADWGATSEYRLKIGDFAPTRSLDPKFQVEWVAGRMGRSDRPFFF